MPSIRVNDTDIHYVCSGYGPPLLLIHGLGSSGDDWAFQREEFARTHTLIMPDLRGSGFSAKPDGPYSIQQFADDLWGLLDALAIAKTAILGFSLGGAVALQMAVNEPARVSKLVLCNALASYRIDSWRKWYEARLQLTMIHVLGLRRSAALISKRMFPHPEQAPKRQRVVDVVGANSKPAYLASVHALIGWSVLDRLNVLHMPTLIIAAEHDYTPLTDKHAELQHFPQAQLCVIEDSRHGTPFDATERFNACVLDFLATPPAATEPAMARVD